MILVCKDSVVKYVFKDTDTIKFLNGSLWLPIRALDIKENEIELVSYNGELPGIFALSMYKYENNEFVLHNQELYLEKYQEFIQKEVVKRIDTLIQSKIDEYNESNGVMFADINAVFKYTANTSYTHYAFCNAITLWNIDVWETVRQIQVDVLSGSRSEPSLETILGELPTLSY